VPGRALSLSIPAILAARTISCVVPDGRKAAAVRCALEGPPSPQCPASALRGHPDVDGRTLTIMPADPSLGLLSLRVTIKGATPIDVGSDGRLSDSDVESALQGREKEAKDVTHSVPIRIDARYVEAGTDRRGGGTYVLRYKWEGGGLFGGRSLHLIGLAR